ncbi:MAG TPA: hypothetical protein QF433_05025, partial [Candidatus Thalassarchaeaceae archaeon]|nr:hypothetical protein [Candidatus Thalassarchaeaceae archaeon]
HGVADLDAQPSGGQGGGGGGPPPGANGRSYEYNTDALFLSEPVRIESENSETIPIWLDFSVTMVLLAILFGVGSILTGRRDYNTG